MTHVDENDNDKMDAMESQNAAPEAAAPDDSEDFEALLDTYGKITQHQRDELLTVPVVKVTKDCVLVDMGDKAEGIIDIQEFMDAQGNVSVHPGESIAVQVMGRDEETGLITLSYKHARVHGTWLRLEQACAQRVPVMGKIVRAVKGGVLVNLDGVEGFMPGSQIGDRKTELEEWVGKEVEARVIEFDREKNKVVLSRRVIIEETRKRALEDSLTKVNVGDIIEGTVKTVLGFGAFLDVAGLDAALPREELSYERAAAPSSLVKVGDKVQVKILEIDRETGRLRVSRKALITDPWAGVAERFPVGSSVTGEVVTTTKFGAFVRIEEGLTGLIHISDLSWDKNARITDHVKEGDTVSAVVVSVDVDKKRLALGLKQLVEDPWIEAERQFPRGTRAKGVITSLAPFGAFVKLTDSIEGLIHISDLSWEGNVKHPSDVLQAGQEVEALVLKTDAATRRIALGLKQLSENPSDAFFRDHPVGSDIEGEVVRMMPTGIFISLAPKIDGFMHISQMALERIDKPEQLFKVGDKVLSRITKIERGNKINLSRKEMIQAEESKLVKQYAAAPAEKGGGMNLGDLLSGIKLNND
ncbi:TPA: hypothetical protein DDW35_02275 [Candidatus Sumerlaeota bacterium]|jgi:small subunit ribosomal protein S1|nr:hypothetical protein [Candidatus Sumerlaeota bacterium]